MVYFATALARTDGKWFGRELDLLECGDLDAVVDALRDLASADDPVLLFAEENDEWFGVVRVDGDGDPRVFLSDSRVLEHSDIAALLFEDAPSAHEAHDDDDDEPSIRPEGDPAGDVDLLADLGTPPGALLKLCAEEGLLPADVISAMSEKAGCLDALEELRVV